MDDPAHDVAARWASEPVEETLDGARQLTVTVADACIRGMWEAVAVEAGIPPRRWRRHHPAPRGRAVIALVDGVPQLDRAAWARVASLVPGAVALPSRTADEFGVARSDLRPPGRVSRLLDMWRARRRRARMRRRERTLDADLSTFQAHLEAELDAVLAPGDDGTPLAELPTYALASRFDTSLLTSMARWTAPAAVDLASGHATSALLRLLVEAGRTPGQALLEAATLQAGGGAPVDAHLQELQDIAAAVPSQREPLLDQWRDSLGGWHASRALLLEATPLRDQPSVVAALFDAPPVTAADGVATPELDELDASLRDAALRARHLAALREQVGRDRSDLHAALRALAHTLGDRLAGTGAITSSDEVFDMTVVELLRVARGGDAPRSSITASPSVPPLAPAASLPAELRGIPASAGVASGRVVVLDAPDLDADVDGAILACRVTDPAWLPLMLRCAGLATERGGPLSHAAIVARELGLPAVVAVGDLRATALAAQAAEIDGSAGIVRLSADA